MKRNEGEEKKRGKKNDSAVSSLVVLRLVQKKKRKGEKKKQMIVLEGELPVENGKRGKREGVFKPASQAHKRRGQRERGGGKVPFLTEFPLQNIHLGKGKKRKGGDILINY